MGQAGQQFTTTNTFVHEPIQTRSLKCSNPDRDARARSHKAPERRRGSRRQATFTFITKLTELWLLASARPGRPKASTSPSRRRQVHQGGQRTSIRCSIGPARSPTISTQHCASNADFDAWFTQALKTNDVSKLPSTGSPRRFEPKHERREKINSIDHRHARRHKSPA